MRADLRYALRGFRRSPGFALVAIFSLALGIGANTAIFSLINAVLLRALPIRDPDRLVMFTLNPPARFGGNYLSGAAFRQIQANNTVLDGFVSIRGLSMTFSSGESMEDVRSSAVSGNFFETLGVNALIGRVLTPDDDRAGTPPVCVIGYDFWIHRFGGDPQVIGRGVLLNNLPFTIAGVTPKPFRGLDLYETTDVTVPTRKLPDAAVQAFGRLKRGISLTQAEASLDVLYHQAETRNSVQQKVADLKVKLQPRGRGVFILRRRYENPLLMLMAVVGLVLLIACANVTNLLLARASGRAREIAVRLALGAGRARLIRQLLAESLLLTMGGGALGIVLAIWADRALKALAPWQIGTPIPPEVDVNPDWRVLLFTMGVAILVSVASGLAPAIQATRPNVAPALKGESGVRLPGRFSFTNALVIAQVALSLVLLIGAGLFLRSLHNLRSVDPGFNPSQLILTTIEPGNRGYSPAASLRYFTELAERARRLPGVVAVSPALISPLSGDFAMARVRVPGYVPQPGEFAAISLNFIGPDYFQTLGTSLVAGRYFTDQDGVANKVAIVNEKAAAHYWPHESAIGKRITTGFRDLFDCEVVGVVKDVKTESLREPAQATVYVPFPLNSMAHITLHVRVAGDTRPVISALLREIHTLDPNLPARNIVTMATQIDRTIALDRLLATLTALFGFLAVVLAAVGLYGVMSFAVAARAREIGIRMALGADRGRVLYQVIRESAVMIVIGIALGVTGAMWASRTIGSQLYSLRATDPATYTALAIALAMVALAAAWIPARRAAAVDPMVALRYE